MAKLLGPTDILVRPQPSSCFRAMWGCCSSHGNHWGSAVAQAHPGCEGLSPPTPTLSLGWAALEAGLFLSYCCLHGQCGERS